MFSHFKNIDTAFKHVKTFSFLLIAACAGISGFALYQSYRATERAAGRIYVLANGKAIEAFASDRKDNLPVELRDHITSFHRWFFSLDPDDQVIEQNISRALDLADESARKAWDNLREQGYYSRLISANISQEITVDSIILDTGTYPYRFRCYATQRMIRSSSELKRRLVTAGSLRNVARSDHNPHGFLIQDWETIENEDLPAR